MYLNFNHFTPYADGVSRLYHHNTCTQTHAHTPTTSSACVINFSRTSNCQTLRHLINTPAEQPRTWCKSASVFCTAHLWPRFDDDGKRSKRAAPPSCTKQCAEQPKLGYTGVRQGCGTLARTHAFAHAPKTLHHLHHYCHHHHQHHPFSAGRKPRACAHASAGNRPPPISSLNPQVMPARTPAKTFARKISTHPPRV